MRICSEVLGGTIHSETRIEEKVTMIRSEVPGEMIRSETRGERNLNGAQIGEEMMKIHSEPRIEEETMKIRSEPRIEMMQTQWLFILANQNYREEMSLKLQYHVCVVIVITRLLRCMTMKGIRSITRCL